MDLDTSQRFLETFGVPMAMLMGLLYLSVRRRRVNGTVLSSFLVPGWVHDNVIAENEAVRSAAIAATLEAKLECEKRIEEYRDLYAAEHALRVELDTRFREVNAREHEQTLLIQENAKLIRELRVEIEESRKRNGA